LLTVVLSGGSLAVSLAVLFVCAAFVVLCEVRSLIERLGAAVFFEDELRSETYGERVKSCPGCGERLEFLSLLLRNLRRWGLNPLRRESVSRPVLPNLASVG
jgi:hypothetical protein